jgi:hypothetical protein
MAITEGSLTKNLNKTGVRLWTDRPEQQGFTTNALAPHKKRLYQDSRTD